MSTMFSFETLANLTSSIANFEILPWQLDSFGFTDPIIKKWLDNQKISVNELGFNRKWMDIDISCFAQLWGSTSGGWGGMGGAAMSTYYTIAIYNKTFNFIAVYWSGKLAYCVQANEEALKKLQEKKMPSCRQLHKLDVIYKTCK